VEETNDANRVDIDQPQPRSKPKPRLRQTKDPSKKEISLRPFGFTPTYSNHQSRHTDPSPPTPTHRETTTQNGCRAGGSPFVENPAGAATEPLATPDSTVNVLELDEILDMGKLLSFDDDLNRSGGDDGTFPGSSSPAAPTQREDIGSHAQTKTVRKQKMPDRRKKEQQSATFGYTLPCGDSMESLTSFSKMQAQGSQNKVGRGLKK
jgi:hypothetical protein